MAIITGTLTEPIARCGACGTWRLEGAPCRTCDRAPEARR